MINRLLVWLRLRKPKPKRGLWMIDDEFTKEPANLILRIENWEDAPPEVAFNEIGWKWYGGYGSNVQVERSEEHEQTNT